MPKATRKYLAAVGTAVGNKISLGNNPVEADEVYAVLNKAGFQWDSDQGKWIQLSAEPADPATELVMIRVWAETKEVDLAADRIIHNMERAYKLVERSEPYTCRPPKQLESRIYLKFMPRRNL